jgi:hypothetical protein
MAMDRRKMEGNRWKSMAGNFIIDQICHMMDLVMDRLRMRATVRLADQLAKPLIEQT